MAIVSRLKAAQFLASQGWKIFPLHWPKDGICSCGKGAGHPIGKHPLVGNWQEAATIDEDKIKAWWKKTPEANIGLATGAASGIIVLDIDGAEGEETVSRNAHEPSITVITGKGRQIYFKHPGEKVRNKVGRFPQLDSRGDGGYVVAPGSLHNSGKLYHFDPAFKPGATPLASAPKWWLEAVVDGAAPASQAAPDASGTHGVKVAKKGGRNSALASLAGFLRDKGLSVEAIKFALLDHNKNHCDPPLDAEEVENIAKSYGRYEQGDPNKKYKVSELTDLLRNGRKFLTSPIDSGGQGVKLMLYQDGVFKPNGADIARRMADKILGNASRPDTINSVVDLIRERTKMHEEYLNPRACELINTLSGMLDWRGSKLHEHSHELLSTFQLQATYDPEVGSPVLDKFINDVFPKDTIPLVEEIIGYLMIPSTKYQKAVMLVGEGANGKSTFLHMLAAFLQECNISRMSLQQLEDSPFSAAELQGKLANVYADIPNSRLEKSDTFKSIVSGDPIKAERKFGHPFTLRTSARLVFSANAFPKSSDSSQAYFRRWIIIPFPNKFEGVSADPDLAKKLTTPESLSALLNRGLAGLRRLEDQGHFSHSESTEHQVESYKVENDSAYEFMKECLRPEPGGRVSKTEVYERYVAWCGVSGVKYPVNTRKLNHTLETSMNLKMVHHGPKRTKSWEGVTYVEAQAADKY